MITGFYAALLALWLVVLSVRVIALRGNPVFKWFAFANSGEESLQRAIRGHGNLIEYAPIFLILMLLAEISDAGATMGALHWYGAVFLMGRLMHGVCFGFMRRNFFLRVGGMILTLFPIAGLAVIMLVQHV